MFDRMRDTVRGAKLMLRDMRARGAAARRPPPLSSLLVKTKSGPAIGLDAQAYLLGLQHWRSDWTPAEKLRVIGDALADRARAGTRA